MTNIGGSSYFPVIKLPITVSELIYMCMKHCSKIDNLASSCMSVSLEQLFYRGAQQIVDEIVSILKNNGFGDQESLYLQDAHLYTHRMTSSRFSAPFCGVGKKFQAWLPRSVKITVVGKFECLLFSLFSKIFNF